MRLLARRRQIASNSPREVFAEFPVITMKVLIVLSALCAVALSSPVSPVLLPEVQVAPAQVTVVKQPYTITQAEPVLRNVPVPYRAVTYTAPHVVPGPVLTPAVAPIVHAPVYSHAPAHTYIAGASPIAYAGHTVVV